MARNLQVKGASGQIAGLLDSNGSMSVDEIASALRTSTKHVKSIANSMYRNDLVRPSGE